MIIDVHAHYFPSAYLRLLDKLGKPLVSTAKPAEAMPVELTRRLELMDTARVDEQWLSISGLMPDLAQPSAAAHAASFVNDLFVEICSASKERLRAFAALPLPHTDLALAEWARVRCRPEIVGVTLACSPAGLGLDHSGFIPLFEQLEAHGSIVLLHPEGRVPDELRVLGATWSVGALVEDTIAFLRLCKASYHERFPNIRFIVPHLGGILPLVVGRLTDPATGSAAALSDAEELRSGHSFWFDTVNGNGATLPAARGVFGVEHLVFGSDFPFVGDAGLEGCVARVRDRCLSSQDQAAILGGNAATLRTMPSGLNHR